MSYTYFDENLSGRSEFFGATWMPFSDIFLFLNKFYCIKFCVLISNNAAHEVSEKSSISIEQWKHATLTHQTSISFYLLGKGFRLFPI